MPYDLTRFLKSLNYEKVHLFEDQDAEAPVGEIEKAYLPWIINKCFSYFPDTLMYAQEMNMHPDLDKRMQYDYYFYSLKKRKRYAKWDKRNDPEELELVKEYFGYSNLRAREVLSLLTDDQLEIIKLKLDKGGKCDSKK